MSGNGRGAQRPQSRPPFLVIGLLVALGILGFNYWNLSSANVTLSATNIDLQDQIRILTSKRLNEEQSKKHVEKKYGLLEQRIAAKDSEIKGLLDDVEIKKVAQEKAEHVVNECNTNLVIFKTLFFITCKSMRLIGLSEHPKTFVYTKYNALPYYILCRDKAFRNIFFISF